MESYLISLEDQEVFIEALEKNVSFKAFESVHVEFSYKYSHSDILSLAEEVGFFLCRTLSRRKKVQWCVSFWKLKKTSARHFFRKSPTTRLSSLGFFSGNDVRCSFDNLQSAIRDLSLVLSQSLWRGFVELTTNQQRGNLDAA